jgi:hypothetical protein
MVASKQETKILKSPYSKNSKNKHSPSIPIKNNISTIEFSNRLSSSLDPNQETQESENKTNPDTFSDSERNDNVFLTQLEKNKNSTEYQSKS